MKLNKKNIAIMTIIAILLSISFIVFLDYIHYECPFRKLLHIYCPGCGATRMMKSLLKLDIYQAFRYNPLIFIFLIIVLPIYIIINIFYYLKYKRLKKITKKEIIILFIIIITYFIVRNLKIGIYLIPTEI